MEYKFIVLDESSNPVMICDTPEIAEEYIWYEKGFYTTIPYCQSRNDLKKISENKAIPDTHVGIIWDTEGEEGVDLPMEVMIPGNIPEDEIADWLADKYGYLVEYYYVINH